MSRPMPLTDSSHSKTSGFQRLSVYRYGRVRDSRHSHSETSGFQRLSVYRYEGGFVGICSSLTKKIKEKEKKKESHYTEYLHCRSPHTPRTSHTKKRKERKKKRHCLAGSVLGHHSSRSNYGHTHAPRVGTGGE